MSGTSMVNPMGEFPHVEAALGEGNMSYGYIVAMRQLHQQYSWLKSVLISEGRLGLAAAALTKS